MLTLNVNMSFIIITLEARRRKLAKYYEIFLLEKKKSEST